MSQWYSGERCGPWASCLYSIEVYNNWGVKKLFYICYDAEIKSDISFKAADFVLSCFTV
jgi:hypothetical protein